MNNLFVNEDGANYQAKAVLAFIRGHEGLEGSYEDGRYQALAEVNRWHNGREQGYVISLRYAYGRRQLNIAFYEHRNHDGICALKWEQTTMNPPNINTLPEGVFDSKWDVTYSVNHGQAYTMAEWIYEQMTSFWKACKDDDLKNKEEKALYKAVNERE